MYKRQFYNNVIMTLCAIGASLIGRIIMMAIMKSSQKYFARQQMALGDVNGHVEEMYALSLIHIFRTSNSVNLLSGICLTALC